MGFCVEYGLLLAECLDGLKVISWMLFSCHGGGGVADSVTCLKMFHDLGGAKPCPPNQ